MANESILELAGLGDPDALACLRDGLLKEAANPDSIFRRSDLEAQAEMAARFAASHGRPYDRAVLACHLFSRASSIRAAGHSILADTFRTEAHDLIAEVVRSGDLGAVAALVGYINTDADAGDPTAVAMLETIFSLLKPDEASTIAEYAREVA